MQIRYTTVPGILAGQPGSAPGTTVLETVMMLFHHWPLDRAAGIAPAISSLGTKRVAGYTTPGKDEYFWSAQRDSHPYREIGRLALFF